MKAILKTITFLIFAVYCTFLLLCVAIVGNKSHAGWLNNFCERHLIADDPHQFEAVSNSALVHYFLEHGTEAARREILHRLDNGEMEAQK